MKHQLWFWRRKWKVWLYQFDASDQKCISLFSTKNKVYYQRQHKTGLKPFEDYLIFKIENLEKEGRKPHIQLKAKLIAFSESIRINKVLTRTWYRQLINYWRAITETILAYGQTGNCKTHTMCRAELKNNRSLNKQKLEQSSDYMASFLELFKNIF